MRQVCRTLVRLGLLGVVLGSSIALVGCGESEPPKFIDTTSQPKIPSQDKPAENKVEITPAK